MLTRIHNKEWSRYAAQQIQDTEDARILSEWRTFAFSQADKCKSNAMRFAFSEYTLRGYKLINFHEIKKHALTADIRTRLACHY
jgi:hypothetical protein